MHEHHRSNVTAAGKGDPPSANGTPLSEERWQPAVGYEGLYEVSDMGRVRRIARITDYPDGRRYPLRDRILRHRYSNKGGYAQVGLSICGKYRKVMVHKLVLAAFVGPLPSGKVTRHLNGDVKDARLVNLAYGTQSENMYDRRAHGTDPMANKTHCPRGHEYTEVNTRRDKQGPQQATAALRWLLTVSEGAA